MSRGTKRNWVSVYCEVCSKEELVPRYRAVKYKTCSIECRSKRYSLLKNENISKKCSVCNELFKVKKSHYKRRKTCSKKCDSTRKSFIYKGEDNPNFENRGESNPLFKGGRRISNYGYVLVYKPNHPNARSDGYILEHRYVMSKHLGRELYDWEVVHHKDDNKKNNDIENLEIMSRSDHTTLHNLEKTIIRDDKGRVKRFINIKKRILVKVPQAEFIEVDELSGTDRGTGGFGHTGVR